MKPNLYTLLYEGGSMMILYRYKELLFLLRIITTMAIPLLSIFIYKTYKDKKLLFLTILIIMELIIIQF